MSLETDSRRDQEVWLTDPSSSTRCCGTEISLVGPGSHRVEEAIDANAKNDRNRILKVFNKTMWRDLELV